MSVSKYIEYKSPGATAWQRIEVVEVVVHGRERESRLREPASRAAMPIRIAELLAAMFGVSVSPEPPPVPPRRERLLLGPVDRMIERFAQQGAEARRQPGSRPGIRSASSRAEKLAELGRILRSRRS
jgi:hypothetical protein